MPRKSKKEIADKELQEELKLAGWCNQKFKEAMLAKEPYTARWLNYMNAWDNSLYENIAAPSYKTNHSSNLIYSTIESMRPILFDSNPAFEAIPCTAEGIPYANDINTILDWEWHRTNMQEKMLANSIYTFTIGTSCVMLPYTFKEKGNTDGEVTPILVSPFNIFPDPLATSMEDAEYFIYANYVHVNKLKAQYPDHAERLEGGDIVYSELVNDRDENARIDNQVLVLEVWCRDYTTIDVEEVDDLGRKIKKKTRKYPKGRVIICAPVLGLILEDKENPYDTGNFPFFIFKDIDVPGQFWGEGEVKWLLSPQQEMNDLYNQIIDNAKHTANMQWIIDKNAGIPKGEITNRPGLIIRKNPNSEVRRDSPPSMPMYVHQMIDTLKSDIEVISGVHDVTRGQTPTGIQSAAAIVALQEAAQIRVRLKVTLHENALGVLGTEWYERIKQFWKFNRVVPRKKDDTEQTSIMGIVQGYEMLEINPQQQLSHDYTIKVRGASIMQTSRASMFDNMVRLMQTPAEDGLPCVPREAVLDYLPDINKQAVLSYFDKLKQEQIAKEQQGAVNNEAMMQIQQLMQAVQELSNGLGQVQQRIQRDDDEAAREEIRAQGYQQGMNEAKALQTQIDKSGQLPPELLQEIAMLDDEALAMVLQQNPELANML